MKTFLVLPTWLIVAAVQPILPGKHVWKRKMPTLGQWARGATDVCVAFGFFFWASIPYAAAAVLAYWLA